VTATPRFDDTLLLITNDGMGHAEPELGRKLLLKYLDLVAENGTPPGAIAFYTRGVMLVTEGSPAIERFAALERLGVRLIVCKTCLDFFGVADKVRVGVVGGMGDIVAAQVLARKVVTL
jgi:intracellular sulfur oxidation DsrE/DsrF family protein